ncbi:lysophospholipid acyltransferase family protein [Marinobacter salinisoli]|uniref:Lysophospholipid acyltransferase family protein n=1 Tax=Marinobacter salinisoli TaxID=2769486 RepID=A0ABX7MTH4_9GAMM|nr:lysophospholipid acyltransferase family protein [Marinobacter salinisoli]QSP95468.1 lysophospholipid acyltransferase family protein [Marinobacter salinisoli]
MGSRSKKTKHPLWHPAYLGSWFVVFILWLLSLLPMATKQRLGGWLGRKLAGKLKSRARVVDANLRVCLPDLDDARRAQLVEDTFVASTRGMLESTHAWWRDVRPYCERATVLGLEHLEEARNNGQGVLLIGGHYSIFDFALPLIACKLDKPGYMYRPNNNPVIDRMIERGRRRHFNIRPFTKRELRPMLSFLKEGGQVWYACDQDFGNKTEVFAPFFGVQAGCITTPSYIARESGAAVICVSHLRLPDGSYRVVFSPIHKGFGDDPQQDAETWNRCIENTIRELPDQYLWLHKRFKTRPQGAAGVY